MSETSWLPSLIVLGIGLAIGLFAVFAVRRDRKRRAAEKTPHDLRLRDLEARRDDLYRRLRSPDLDPGDRESLELAAARTLRDLDQLAPGRAESRPAAAEAPEPAAPPEPAPLPISGRHPALVGFVAGMAVVLLVGSLVYLAVRDADPASPPAVAASGVDEPHPTAQSLPAEKQRDLEQLEAAVAAAPNDLLAIKRLALARLEAGLMMEAFRDADQILSGRPEDPDGLFIKGVVRLSMGQAAEAIDLLDRVLVNFPEHLQAMIYRGLALAQTGQIESAIDTWEMGLEMAGGSHPDLEMLLQQAHGQQQALAAAPPPAESPAPPPTPAEPPPRPDPAPAAGPAPRDAYQVTIELAPGRAAPPTGVLFVFLRPGETGAPTAVKRIPTPRFPLTVTLGATDVMMGGATLPQQGFLVARLSPTGDVSRGPDDLEASAPAAVGQTVRLALGDS